jgi:hypothetical protein
LFLSNLAGDLIHLHKGELILKWVGIYGVSTSLSRPWPRVGRLPRFLDGIFCERKVGDLRFFLKLLRCFILYR